MPNFITDYKKELNVKQFGAVGDGIADDTAAIQLALDALMATAKGTDLYFPMGVYKITYTLLLVGDYGHNYVIKGAGGGLSNRTVIRWAGPPKCTMLDCWGLNLTTFSGLIFDGGGASLHVGGYSTPGVAIVGAGCGTWFHTNQFSTHLPAGFGPAATFFVNFDDCSWEGVIGGLYASCAVGDGYYSPADITIDKNGNYTIYQVETITPPTIGVNAVDTVHQTTLVGAHSANTHTFKVVDASNFHINRAIIVSKAGVDPWCGRIDNVDDSNTITASDENGNGLSFNALDGYKVYNVYPQAVGMSIPAGTVVQLPIAIQNSECQGFFWTRCNFLGGGYDTTILNQYNYANVALYSGYNAEQYGWRDCNFHTQTAVMGIFSPTNPNNEFFLENCQFASYSGACVWLGAVNFAKLSMFQCATESNTGCGYFLLNQGGAYGGTAHIDGCEIVTKCVANPFTSIIASSVSTVIERSTFSNQFYDTGSNAQPLSVVTSGDLAINNCVFFGEELQIPVFYAGIDLFSDNFGTDGHPNTNRTHSFSNNSSPGNTGQAFNGFTLDVRVSLNNNLGTLVGGSSKILPNLVYRPGQQYSIGPMTNSYTPAATEVFRAETRRTTSLYTIDGYQQAPSGGTIYLFVIQPKTLISSVVIETTQSFSSYTTLNCGTQLGSYADFMSGIAIPPTDAATPGGAGLIVNYLPSSTAIANSWQPGGYNSFGVTLTPTTTLTAGKLNIFITMDLLL